ncbi:GntR family transcriptional regulator [Lachnospiraceae bacterium 54-53]
MSLLPLQKLPPRRPAEDARQYAYRILRHFILNLHLPPGRKMNEVELANALSISRTPVHDTLYKLSRKNLVDIIPQKGAFVSRIDSGRIEQTLWIHTQLGTAMLQNIFIRNVKAPQFDILYHNLQQQEDYLEQGDLSQSVRLITDYYRLLYELAGKMDHIWDSVQKAGMDLQRLLYLSASNASVARDFLVDLTALTDALAGRDTDRACTIYHHHLSRIHLLIPPLKECYPDYFMADREEKTESMVQNRKGLLYGK